MSIRAMQQEIAFYSIPKPIKNAMLKLARIGYEPSGHGCGIGSEDWNIIKDFGKDGYIYINFNWDGKRCASSYTFYVNDEAIHEVANKPAFTVRAIAKIKNKKMFDAACKPHM